mmetsp:Transcript_10/g.64  ORF Transcript_10/g.64 Transcript_10/m.64 type:complete len:356 (+) Transcript_10:286-1353(+)
MVAEAVDALVLPFAPVARGLGLPDTRVGRTWTLLVAFVAAYALGYVGGRIGSPDADDALVRCHHDAKKAQAWIVAQRSCAFEAQVDADAERMAWEAAQFFARTARTWTSSCTYVQVGVGSDLAAMQARLRTSFVDDDAMHGCFKALFVERRDHQDALRPLVGAHGDECVLLRLPDASSKKRDELIRSVGELRGLQPDASTFVSWHHVDDDMHVLDANATVRWTLDADVALRRARVDTSTSVVATLDDVARLERDGYAVHALGFGVEGRLDWALRIDGDLFPSRWKGPSDVHAFVLLATKQSGAQPRAWERELGVCVDEEWDQTRACRCVPRRWEQVGRACPVATSTSKHAHASVD